MYKSLSKLQIPGQLRRCHASKAIQQKQIQPIPVAPSIRFLAMTPGSPSPRRTTAAIFHTSPPVSEFYYSHPNHRIVHPHLPALARYPPGFDETMSVLGFSWTPPYPAVRHRGSSCEFLSTRVADVDDVVAVAAALQQSQAMQYYHYTNVVGTTPDDNDARWPVLSLVVPE